MLGSSNLNQQVKELFRHIHAVVLGPGLGRNSQGSVEVILSELAEKNIPLVLDADGLYYLPSLLHIVKNIKNCIITPNIMEFKRLQEFLKLNSTRDPVADVDSLSKELGVTVLLKGEKDIISNGEAHVVCDIPGSLRRCGGQGDILSGALGIFYHWTLSGGTGEIPASLCAGAAASALTKTCSNLAFSKHRRSMTTSDMLECLPQAFQALFKDKN